MPVSVTPDGLGLADRYSPATLAILNWNNLQKSLAAQRKSYASSSANTTKYLKYPKKPALKRPPVVRPKTASKPGYSVPSAPKLGGGSYNPNPGGISLPGASSNTLASFGGRSNSQLMQMAREAVSLELDPKIKGIELARSNEMRDYTGYINTLRKELGMSKGDVKSLYNALDIGLAANAQKQQQINTQTKASVGQLYDQLTGMLGTNYQGAENRVTSELSRLGITNPDATSRLTADQQFMQGLTGSSKANAQSTIDEINSSTQGVMSLLRGGGAATGSMLQSQLQQQYDKSYGEAVQTHLKKAQELDIQRRGLINSRGSKVNQTYQALLDQQYQREMDAAQSAFDNQIKLANLGVSQQSAQATSSYHQNQLALEAQRIANQAAKDKATSTKSQTGMEKALSYLQGLSYVKSKAIPFSTMEQILIDAINGDPNRADYPGYNSKYMSQYGNDILNSVRSRGLPSGTYTDLINAMHYMFNR